MTAPSLSPQKEHIKSTMKIMNSYKVPTNCNEEHRIKYFRDNYAQSLEKHIDTYFHPHKDIIWNKIKSIHFEPEFISSMGQYPQETICLYGPPGTGKSSFAYRVAMALGRGLLSID